MLKIDAAITFIVVSLAQASPTYGTQSPVAALTNDTVVEMVRAGVPYSLVLSRITNEPHVQFSLSPQDLIVLTKAGVSEALLQAMEARMQSRQVARPPVAASIPGRASPPQHFSPEPPVARVVTPPGDVDSEDWRLSAGRVEASLAGGVSIGKDIEGDAIIPSFGASFGIGLNRHLAAVGNFGYHMLGDVDYVSCVGVCTVGTVKVKAQEFTGGIRASIPNSTRFTPFFTGSVGALRASAGTRVLGIGVSASDFAFIGGGGVGFDVAINRNVGFQYDLRVFAGQYGLLYGHTTAGVYFRFR
jgi:hypothetical protein